MRSEEFHDAAGYRGAHQPNPDDPAMHEAEVHFQGIHENPRWYNHGGATYDESIRHIQKVRNKPDADITIYRAVPHGVTEINHGDWVTTSKQYAKTHGLHPEDPKQDMPVISKKVKAKHLRTPGDDVNEWGYYPS